MQQNEKVMVRDQQNHQGMDPPKAHTRNHRKLAARPQRRLAQREERGAARVGLREKRFGF